MKNWYCGFLLSARENWRDLVPTPTPPSNYTKQPTIDAWIDKRMAELPAECATRPLLGEVVDFAIVDDDGDVLVSGSGKDGYPKLVELVGDPTALGSVNNQVRLWGLQIRTRLHQIAVNAFEAGFTGASWGLYANTHTSRPAVLDDIPMSDPVKLLTGSDTDDSVAVCRKLLGNEGAWMSAAKVAEFVRDLTMKFHLSSSVI